jgi:UDP-glucuronate 4-epimerase
VEVGKLIEIIEQQVGKKAKLNMMPMQPGDVPVTYADVDELARDIAYRPETSIEVGVARFVEWYRRHYKL